MNPTLGAIFAALEGRNIAYEPDPHREGIWLTRCPACRGEAAVYGFQELDPFLACRGECGASEPAYAALGLSLNGASANGADAEMEPVTSWAPVDLGPILDGDQLENPPSLLRRTDGARLLYADKIHNFSGEPEACKGWLALHATTECLTAGKQVLYIDFEDSAETLVERLVALGVEREAILERLDYLRPDEPLEPYGQAELERLIALRPALAVIDGVTEALTMHGLDLGDNADIAKWLGLLPRTLARAGIPVIQVDHVVKDRESRGRWPIGGQHKLAGVDVAFGLEVVRPFGRGQSGLVVVKIAKDRPGFVRGVAVEGRVAEMHLTSEEDGSVHIELRPPAESSDGGFRPTYLMEKISKSLERQPGLTTNGIRNVVRAKHEARQLAVELLVAEGYLRVERDGQAHRHHVVKPYRADDEEGSEE